MHDAAKLRRKAIALHAKAGRCWFRTARAKRLSVRAWNLDRAATMLERQQRAAERDVVEASPARMDPRRDYALAMARVAPSITEAERQARIAAYDARFGGQQ